MARKILNRKELREENDEAERTAITNLESRGEEAARQAQEPCQGGQGSPFEGVLGRLQSVLATNRRV